MRLQYSELIMSKKVEGETQESAGSEWQLADREKNHVYDRSLVVLQQLLLTAEVADFSALPAFKPVKTDHVSGLQCLA